MDLYDYANREYALETNDPEEAVAYVGAIMTALGPDRIRGRYILFEDIEGKKKDVRVVYTTEELWERALAYFYDYAQE